MPRFLAEKEAVVVSTSYKVMYSTLVACPSLREIGEARARASQAGTREMRHILFVRDPYERLRSFYRDKLVRNLEGRPRGNFQWCQRFILRQMGLWPFASYDRKLEALRTLGFEGFLKILPHVKNNGHLRPQVSLLRSRRHELPEPDFVHRVENDLSVLAGVAPFLTGLGRVNVTGQIGHALPIAGEDLARVNAIYAEDFAQFGYAVRDAP